MPYSIQSLARWARWRRVTLAALLALTLGACTLPEAAAPTPIAATVAPEVEPTSAPTAPPAPEPTELPASIGTTGVDEIAAIRAATPAARDQRQLVAAFSGVAVPAVARTTPLDVRAGDIEQFWVADVSNNTNYTITARLRYAGPVVLMYVDEELDIPQDALERSARAFEQQIYPRNRTLFGAEVAPGVDGDPRLTVLNTSIRGAGGYFSSADGVTRAVNRFSNERDMFVIDAIGFPPGSEAYNATLAHEFQHMIHWHRQIRSPTWFNEGLSTLAEDLNGFGDNGAILSYLRDTDLQLTTWSSGPRTLAHYGVAQLFMRYVYEQYAGDSVPADWIAADVGNNVEELARLAALRRPDISDFETLFADWAVANLVNDPAIGDGRYAYRGLPRRVTPDALASDSVATDVRQFGVDYLGAFDGPLTIAFDGADAVSLVGASPVEGRFAWWSNRGDESVSSLTRAFDLRDVRGATLSFRLWYELERHYDYAFVAVSVDGGATWRGLPGSVTTDDDPQGHNLGNGITGVSGVSDGDIDGERGRWVEERMDLTPFAGQEILLRFMTVSDAALNGPGLLLDDIRIPEIGFSDTAETAAAGWQAEGFVRTSGMLPQRWLLRVVRFAEEGVTIDAPDLDAQGRAEIRLLDGERAIVLVSGATPYTTEPARYRVDLVR